MSGDRGINTALLQALPDARKVLELGCAAGLLGERYKSTHPGAEWHGIDISDASLAAASHVLDSAVRRDLETDAVSTFGDGYDLIVLGDVLEHLRSPERLLAHLREISAPGASLFCSMPNLAHASVLERSIAGDVMYDDAGLLDRTHLRIFSPRSVFKMFLDAGWVPKAVSRYRAGHANAAFLEALYAAAQALGVSREDAEYSLETYQLIIGATMWRQPAAGPPLDLTVVVNVTNETLYSLNLARSPGLSEIGATIVPIKGAPSSAAALAFAADHSQSEWLMAAPQDLYLPKGAGFVMSRGLKEAGLHDTATLPNSGTLIVRRSSARAFDPGRPPATIEAPVFRAAS